jgi:hypothetical protein
VGVLFALSRFGVALAWRERSTETFTNLSDNTGSRLNRFSSKQIERSRFPRTLSARELDIEPALSKCYWLVLRR